MEIGELVYYRGTQYEIVELVGPTHVKLKDNKGIKIVPILSTTKDFPDTNYTLIQNWIH